MDALADTHTHGIRSELMDLAVDIGALSPHPDNPNDGDQEAIEESLRVTGQYRPIVVHRQTGEILAGNTTYAAAMALGWSHMAVTYVDADSRDEALRILLADNQTARKGRINDAQLMEILVELSETANLEGTGYDQDDMDDLMATLDRVAVTPLQVGETSFNDTEADMERRVAANGGEGSRTMESRGIRDIILALPNADADEISRLIQRLRDVFGNLSQGEVLLRAARAAVAVIDGGTGHGAGCDCAWCTVAREAGARL